MGGWITVCVWARAVEAANRMIAMRIRTSTENYIRATPVGERHVGRRKPGKSGVEGVRRLRGACLSIIRAPRRPEWPSVRFDYPRTTAARVAACALVSTGGAFLPQQRLY